MNGLVSGATAAIALTAMHECTRKSVDDAPRADLLGMRALAKAAHAAGTTPPEPLREWTMAGDLVCNALYYSVVGLFPKRPVLAGTLAGCAAAAGLIGLPGPLGLGTDAVNRTNKTEALGAALYITAGVIAGCTYKYLDSRD